MVEGSKTKFLPNPTKSYRPEIDGLRALAVIAVLINHLWVKALPGGYLGVDIFFVISGYVVTSSLVSRRDGGWRGFLVKFYQRRFRRLAPALILNVLIVSLLFSAFSSPLDDVRVPSIRTGIAALFGVSNLYLLRQGADYFAPSTLFNPFTHTWSLGVEEQFYLVWPILILLCGIGTLSARQPLRRLTWMSLALMVGSLGFYLHLSLSGRFDEAFYLMPARFWELASGCLAFIVHTMLSVRRSILSGFRKELVKILIAAAIIVLLAGPDSWRLGATLAIALLTAFLLVIVDGHGRLGLVLTHPSSLFLGVRSYSLYLWHWPVIVLARWTFGLSVLTIIPVMLLITLLTVASYHIETYFRYRTVGQSFFSHPIIFYPLAASFTAALAFMLQGSWRWVAFVGEKRNQLSDSMNMKRIAGTSINTVNCFRDPLASLDLANADNNCLVIQNPKHPTLFFEGDSHANVMIPLGEEILRAGQYNVSFFARGGCPFPYFAPRSGGMDKFSRYKLCQPHYQARVDRLISMVKPGDSLVLVTNLNGHFRGLTMSEKSIAEASYSKQIISLSKLLQDKGARLIIFAPIPFFAAKMSIESPISLCSPEWFRPAGLLSDVCKPVLISRPSHIKSVAAVEQLISRLSSRLPNVFVYHPLEVICPPTMAKCSTHKGSILLFSDSNHLTNYGVMSLYPSWAKFLEMHASGSIDHAVSSR